MDKFKSMALPKKIFFILCIVLVLVCVGLSFKFLIEVPNLFIEDKSYELGVFETIQSVFLFTCAWVIAFYTLGMFVRTPIKE